MADDPTLEMGFPRNRYYTLYLANCSAEQFDPGLLAGYRIFVLDLGRLCLRKHVPEQARKNFDLPQRSGLSGVHPPHGFSVSGFGLGLPTGYPSSAAVCTGLVDHAWRMLRDFRAGSKSQVSQTFVWLEAAGTDCTFYSRPTGHSLKKAAAPTYETAAFSLL